jgi:hypothetical protein
MSEAEQQRFHEKVAATAIANQAVLRCILMGMPVTIDNVIRCVSDFLDPNEPSFDGLIEQIEKAIEVTVMPHLTHSTSDKVSQKIRFNKDQ